MKVYEEQLEDVLSDVLASLPRDSFQLKPEQKQAIRTDGLAFSGDSRVLFLTVLMTGVYSFNSRMPLVKQS